MDLAIAESAYGIKYSWADETARLAQVDMVEFEQGVQLDNRKVYAYNGSDWVEFYALDGTHIHDDRYYTKTEVAAYLAGKSDTGHSHAISDTTGLQGALDGKEPAFAKGTGFNKDLGTASGTVAEGDHTHTSADVGALASDHPLALGAMTKAEYRARQEKNKRDYAGSGFVEFGSTLDHADGEDINQGMWCYPTNSAYANKLVLGRQFNAVRDGNSRTDMPITLVNGTLFHLNGNVDGGYHNEILLPPSPDGKSTYDSSSGVKTVHSDSNSAFEGLVTNGDFRNDTIGWAESAGRGSFSVTDGIATITDTTGEVPYNGAMYIRNEGINYIAGITYRIEVTVKSLSGQAKFRAGTISNPDLEYFDLSIGSNIFEWTSTSTDGGANTLIYVYDSGTVEISSISIMPATESVIITRTDLGFKETFEELVSLKDIVVPGGGVQDGRTSWEGIDLVGLDTLGVGQGYSAFGEWDTTTQGKGVKWSTLSTEDKKTFLADPENHIFLNSAGELVQTRFRIRVIEGLGDEWDWENFFNTYTSRIYGTIGTSINLDSQGISETPTKLTEIANVQRYVVPYHNGDSEDRSSMRNLNSDSNLSYSGYVNSIPLFTCQRLNSGAYSPVHNPYGTAPLVNTTEDGASLKWYEATAKKPLSTADCFKIGTGYAGNFVVEGRGSIASGQSGRDDQFLYYDAIYSGLITDLRIDCNKMDKKALLESTVRKAIAGEFRGKGKVPYTHWIDGSMAGTGVDSYAQNKWYVNGSDNFYIYVDTSVYGNKFEIGKKYRVCDLDLGLDVVGICDNVIDAPPSQFVSLGSISNLELRGSFYPSQTNNSPAPNNGTVVVIEESWLSPTFNKLPWQDIVADPAVLAQTFPEGCLGMWIPKIPDNLQADDLNRKANGTAGSRTYTDDNGATWTYDPIVIDGVLNQPDAWTPANRVNLIQYSALSDFTESADNTAVLEVGNVFSSSRADIFRGNRMMGSFTGKVNKDNTAGNLITTKPNRLLVDPNASVWKLAGGVYTPRHEPIDLLVPANSSPAFKSVFSLIEKSGLLYGQFHWKELHYDSGGTVGNEWGDTTGATTYTNAYGTIPIVDGESTMEDGNTNTVKYGTHHSLFPLGIANKNEE